LPPTHPPTDQDPTRALGHAWRPTDDPALRDRLVLAHAPMVKWIAYRKVRALPAWCDMDDFISAGIEAILRSLDRYDPAKGATLEQYLWTRVHGAVLDELRKHDWAPRSVRRGLRAAGEADDHFTAIHGRHPTRDELAEATGMTVAELRALHDDGERAEVASLNVPVRADDHQVVERIDTLEDRDAGEDPLEHAAGEQAQDTFRAAFTRLPEREQVLAVLLYVEGLTLREAGQAIGISESRASQLHTRLRARLRAELAGEHELFALA
jgi:RNA polymerase sigma factor for flagellar operon FliA